MTTTSRIPEIATYEHPFLLVDGKPVGPWLRDQTTAGTTVYAGDDVPPSRLRALVAEKGDICMGSPGGTIRGVRLAVCGGKGRVTILTGTSWGVDGRGEVLRAGLSAIMDDCATHGIEYRSTAASTARYLLRGLHPELHRLAPRWRETALASIHAAPIAHCTGGAEHAVHADRTGAFLDALRQPLPRPEAQVWAVGPDNPRALAGDGLVVAEVTVPDDIVDVPPLPITQGAQSHSPVGTFWGVWPLPWLRYAVEAHGVAVQRVHGSCRMPPCTPWLRDYADLVDGLGPARKPLYTRVWGLMCAGAMWTGYPPGYEPDSGVLALGLAWCASGGDLMGNNRPHTYRPDISAYICMHNALEMHRAMARLEKGTIIATHIDAIWTRDVDGGRALARSPGWHGGREGPLRVWAPGVYKHADHMGYSEWSDKTDPPDAGRLEVWAANGRQPTARVWSASPRTHPDAVSSPGYPPGDYSLTWARDAWDPTAWTPGGYCRET